MVFSSSERLQSSMGFFRHPDQMNGGHEDERNPTEMNISETALMFQNVSQFLQASPSRGSGKMCLDGGDSSVLPLLATQAAVDYAMLLMMIAVNAFIVTAIARQRRNGTVSLASTRFAANLAAADAFVGFVTLYYLAFHYLCSARSGLGGIWWACTLRFFTVSSAHMTSAYSLVTIAIDRYIAVMHALRYREILNSKRSSILIALVWICSFSINSTLFLFNTWRPGSSCELEDVVPLGYMIACGIATHGCIVVVVASLHYKIHREAMAVRTRRRSGAPVMAREDPQPPWRSLSTKSARIVLYVTGVYLTCWAPYILLYLIKVGGLDSETVDVAQSLAYTFANTNYLINPFLYSWKNASVRQCIIKTLREIGFCQKGQLHSSIRTVTSERSGRRSVQSEHS